MPIPVMADFGEPGRLHPKLEIFLSSLTLNETVLICECLCVSRDAFASINIKKGLSKCWVEHMSYMLIVDQRTKKTPSYVSE